MKRLSFAFMLGGVLLAIGLVFLFGARHVLDALLSVGWWGFLALIGAQLGLTLFLALAWFLVVPKRTAGLFGILYWGRLVREAGGRFLPFLPVGGFVIGARAVSLTGMPMALSAASTLVDVASEFTAEVMFAALGLGILLVWQPHSDLILPLGAGIVIAALAAGTFIALPGRGTRVVQKLAARIGAGESRALGSLDHMSSQFDAIYARKGAIIAAVLCHFCGWVASASVSWLAYHLLGAPITMSQALAIEALLRAALTITFFVPGNAGVQEAAYAALGAIFGLPVQISVAVSLISRARDLVVGVPPLLLWQWLEYRSLRRRSGQALATSEAQN
ncbi:MAG TPA: lysylphosphatidylglycerol synthase domain-containing protein [Acidisoma sp.]|uniref:lysylphosphatidylglycerol synthase domain-containing protein n=1 Tax=Acidisoma sp. TaxID=1872115 RepID=UPI002D18C81D|nr:lysylphosphatidylglycerol synthase domain-containing protein [Acidisoma sp.]HTI03585.1 lysylphosphatidylglycerol synthase domain-containing protein [Acidisoma sp.]